MFRDARAAAEEELRSAAERIVRGVRGRDSRRVADVGLGETLRERPSRALDPADDVRRREKLPPERPELNLRCAKCGRRFYSASPHLLVGSRCPVQGCDGTLELAGP